MRIKKIKNRRDRAMLTRWRNGVIMATVLEPIQNPPAPKR